MGFDLNVSTRGAGSALKVRKVGFDLYTLTSTSRNGDSVLVSVSRLAAVEMARAILQDANVPFPITHPPLFKSVNTPPAPPPEPPAMTKLHALGKKLVLAASYGATDATLGTFVRHHIVNACVPGEATPAASTNEDF